MELSELRTKIIDTFCGNNDELVEVLRLIENDHSVFPFNEYELLLSTLIDRKGITFQQYIDIRTEYINANPNLWIFEISAPRGFGEKFAQTYIRGKSDKLLMPNKKLDPTYSGQYDLWFNGIRIEVKASRATDAESEAPLYVKALSKNTYKPFLMNFQQLKPQCCDVFIWLAVFRDEIIIWVLNSDEVINNDFFSKGQHRGNIGNEGQLHIKHDNIHYFDKYKLTDNNIEKAIQDAFERTLKNI